MRTFCREKYNIFFRLEEKAIEAELPNPIVQEVQVCEPQSYWGKILLGYILHVEIYLCFALLIGKK